MKNTAMMVYVEMSGDTFPLDDFVEDMQLAPTHSAKKGERITVGNNG